MLMLNHPYCKPPYRAFPHSYKIENGDDIWPNRPIHECSRHENLERTHGWCSAVGKVAF